MSTRTDADLVAAAREGDRDGFAELYERYSTGVHDFALRLTRSTAEAADVTQDAFVTALERLDQLRDPDRFKSWLFAIAYRRSLKGIGAVRRQEPTDDERRLTEVDPDRLADPERASEMAAAATLVWDVAASLDARTYTLLDLHVRRDLGAAEIAEILDITPNHASVQLHRMRATVEAAMLTYLLAKLHRRDCDALDTLLYGTNAVTPAIRADVERHVDACEQCGRRRRALVAPMQAFAALAAVEAPPRVATGVHDAIEAHYAPQRPWWRRGGIVAGLVLFLLGGGIGVGQLVTASDPSPLAPVALPSASEPPSPEATRSPLSSPSPSPAPPSPDPSVDAMTVSPTAPADPPTVDAPPPPPPTDPAPTSARPSSLPTATTGPTATPSEPRPQPPTVTVLAPRDDLAVCPGSTVTFRGTADDPDGADPADDAYRWSSSRDGLLGHGPSLSAALDRTGPHVVTLAVTDTDGQVGTDRVTVTVRDADSQLCEFTATIVRPPDGTTAKGTRRRDGRADVTLHVLGEVDHGEVDHGEGQSPAVAWTSSQQPDTVLSDAPQGQLQLVADCNSSLVLSFTATDSWHRQASDAVTVQVAC